MWPELCLSSLQPFARRREGEGRRFWLFWLYTTLQTTTTQTFTFGGRVLVERCWRAMMVTDPQVSRREEGGREGVGVCGGVGSGALHSSGVAQQHYYYYYCCCCWLQGHQ